MMTLGEIIESVKNGEKTAYEDLRYAVCALEALLIFDSMALRRLYEAEEKGKKPILTSSAKWQWEEEWSRNKKAFEKSPKEWVGWNNNPDNPDYQKRREVAQRLYAHIMKNNGTD